MFLLGKVVFPGLNLLFTIQLPLLFRLVRLEVLLLYNLDFRTININILA